MEGVKTIFCILRFELTNHSIWGTWIFSESAEVAKPWKVQVCATRHIFKSVHPSYMFIIIMISLEYHILNHINRFSDDILDQFMIFFARAESTAVGKSERFFISHIFDTPYPPSFSQFDYGKSIIRRTWSISIDFATILTMSRIFLSIVLIRRGMGNLKRFVS